ncbi:MAG: hypothetical protein WCI72_04075 [archaeon]
MAERPNVEERLAMYREAEVALREFFSADKYCLENCIKQEFSKFRTWNSPGRLGCCDHNYFEWCLEPNYPGSSQTLKEFKKLQQENATCQVHREGECDYHSETGCQVKQYLSPICLGFICVSHIQYLAKTYGIEYSEKTGNRLGGILDGIETQKNLNIWLTKIRKATERVKKGKRKQTKNQKVIEI